MADAVLTQLIQIRTSLISRIHEIRTTSGHALNNPDVKTADGGTTLDKQAYLKQLMQELKDIDDAIERHNKAIDPDPFEYRTQLELD